MVLCSVLCLSPLEGHGHQLWSYVLVLFYVFTLKPPTHRLFCRHVSVSITEITQNVIELVGQPVTPMLAEYIMYGLRGVMRP